MATITLVAGWLRLYERELAGGGGAAGLMATNWAWSLSYHNVLQRPNNCLAADRREMNRMRIHVHSQIKYRNGPICGLDSGPMVTALLMNTPFN